MYRIASHRLDGLLQKLLGLVDLGGQVRAAATIGMVEKHEGAVGLADLVLSDGALAVLESGC